MDGRRCSFRFGDLALGWTLPQSTAGMAGGFDAGAEKFAFGANYAVAGACLTLGRRCANEALPHRELLSFAFGAAIATLLILAGLVATLGAAAINRLDRPRPRRLSGERNPRQPEPVAKSRRATARRKTCRRSVKESLRYRDTKKGSSPSEGDAWSLRENGLPYF